MFETSEYQNSFSGLNSPPYNNQPFGEGLDSFSLTKNSNSALSPDPQLRELELSSATDANLIPFVQAAIHLVKEQLTEVALSSEYDRITGLAFGDNYNQEIADSLRQSFAQGDLSELPDIQVISSDILGNANGAYAKQLDTIFLSDEFVRSHTTQEIAGVLTEEIGHYIDSRINTVDAAGDEGDIFSRLVQGKELSSADLALLKEEDDSAVIAINGQEVSIEKSNTLRTAYNIGTLSGSRSFSDWVGRADTNDYYRFYVGSRSNFSLNLRGLTADADVQLLNSSGTVINRSTAGGSSNEFINHQLGTGTYYVRVFPYGSANTNYNLSLNATPLDYAGNSLSSARNIGTLSGSRSFSDWVGRADTNDYYRFYVGSQSNFSLNLRGLTADADVQLLNSSGTVINRSTAGGSSNESINTQLNTGTYYVRVFPYGSANTNYNLSLNATPDYAGNSLSSARDIGTLNSSRSFSDLVGSADSNDYYRFYVGSRSNFSLNLRGLTADADVHLLNSSGTVINCSTAGGSSNESINTQLNSGTYYVRVFPYGSANTSYSLNLSGVSLSSQIRSGSENVNLWLYNTNGRNTTDYINPDRETVVVIHGWSNNDQTEGINRLARETAEFGTQVLALDWGGIANDPDELDSWWGDAVPNETAQWITPVAQWASNLLGNLGIASNQLTLIGHSLGTYVASEIGRIGGQVRNLVALDPADNPTGNYDLDIHTAGEQRPVDFRNVAQYSLSFVVGDLDHGLAGNNNQAATAHDSFVISDWGQYWSTDLPDDWAHGAVVDLFRNALDRRLLSPTDLTMPSHQDGWYNNNGDRNNRNNGQHEGYINASWVNNDWRIAGLRRVIDSSGTQQWAWT